MNKLDWRHYTIATLLLAALASWGARERTWTKRLDAETAAHTKSIERVFQAEAKIAELQETHKRELAKAYERGRKRSERRLPDGTVEITEEEIERSTETAREEARREIREQYEAEIARASQFIYELRAQVRQLETETVKSAPRWAAALGWDPLADDELARWRVGLGLNIGPLTGLATAAPAALATGALTDTRPQLEAVLRF